MVSPDMLTNGLANIFKSAGTATRISYMAIFTWIFWGVVVTAVFAFFYFWISLKYKITVHEGSIEYDKNGNPYPRILKVKRDRAMLINDHGINKWKLFFARKKIEPIDNKYIQPGNFVSLFRTGPDTFNPMPVRVGNPSFGYDIDPFDKSFLFFGMQQDAMDYQKDDALKKAQTVFVIVMIGLLIFAGFILWLSFRSAGQTTEKMGVVAKMFENAQALAPK